MLQYLKLHNKQEGRPSVGPSLKLEEMAEKKKISNKGEKKAAATKKIDWDSIPEKNVAIIHKGKQKTCGKPSAKALVEKGLAKLA